MACDGAVQLVGQQYWGPKGHNFSMSPSLNTKISQKCLPVNEEKNIRSRDLGEVSWRLLPYFHTLLIVQVYGIVWPHTAMGSAPSPAPWLEPEFMPGLLSRTWQPHSSAMLLFERVCGILSCILAVLGISEVLIFTAVKCS